MTITKPIHTGTHDLPVSGALAEFLKLNWAPSPLSDPAPRSIAPWAARRRDRLSARFPGERLVVPAGILKVRSNSVDYRFRPHTAFSYLTGGEEPDSVLILEPTAGGHEAVLHLRPRSPRDTDEFYRDRRYGEIWVGRRNTLAEAATLLGIATAHLDDVPARLRGSAVPTRVLREVDPNIDALVAAGPGGDDADLEFASFLSELRLVKDEWEVAQLQEAVDATAAGFADVVRALPEAVRHRRGERWIEGVFGLRARAEGNGLGYETIAAAGAHACVLHWISNDGPVRPGELLLLDAGVESDTLYTADITRTLPISGTFTTAQRDVYDLVLAAQNAGIAAVRPGARFRDFHLAAMRVIAEGLYEWGLLRVTPDEALKPDSGLFRRYTWCSSGHMLGLDLHDCAKARAETYLDGVLEVGNVLTVEPGLYLQPDDLTLPLELRGLGVRIEDDLVVTEDGARLMSSALPREASAVESWMGELLA
jgi:Xaa-Pro aminopeptidase